MRSQNFYAITKPPPGVLIDDAHPLNYGVRGLWLFNEGAGLCVHDVSNRSGGADFIFTGPRPVWRGKLWSGVRVDNTAATGNIRTVITPRLNLIDALSCELWCEYTSASANGAYLIIMATATGTLPKFRILRDGTTANAILQFYGEASNAETYLGYPVVDGLPHHIVITYDQFVGVLNVYVDGKLGASAALAVPIQDSATEFHIGQFPTGTLKCDGYVYKATVWDRMLSLDEVRWLRAEPFGMLLPDLPRRSYSTVAAPTGNIPEKMFHYRQLRAA